MTLENLHEAEPQDPTFRNYNPNQAASFAQQRQFYSPALYQAIIDYHIANGGHFNNLLDVGCGSGAAIRSLAEYFSYAMGTDPGRELIFQARNIGGQTKTGNLIQYEILSAEDLCLLQTIEHNSVDLLSVGMAVGGFLKNRIRLSLVNTSLLT